MRVYFALVCMLLFGLSPLVSEGSVRGQSLKVKQAYQSLCTTKTSDNAEESAGDVAKISMSMSMEKNNNNMRRGCMCSFLHDVTVARTELHSTTTLASSSSSGGGGGPYPCIDGYVRTPNDSNLDDYPCQNVDLLSFVSLAELNSMYGESEDYVNDVWGWTDTDTGMEIALVGTESGTAFVDVTDPVQARYLGKLPRHEGDSFWRDIKTYQNHAFAVSEEKSHGLQIFDLTQLVGLSGGPQTFTETAHVDGFGDAHNLFINESTGFAYVVGSDQCQGGLYMLDLSNPIEPEFVGCFSDLGYTHDVQCVLYGGDDGRYAGREICFACNEDHVAIIDVTDKDNPETLSTTEYSQVSYTHQGWLTLDHNHFLFGDESDEKDFRTNTRTLILNVADLESPFVDGTYLASTKAIDHNLYILDNLVYQTNYQAGFRVLEIDSDSSTGSLDLNEIGFLDTWPDGDEAKFNSVWSSYPYFASGSILVSDTEQGLFVVKYNPTTSPSTESTPSELPSPSPSGIPSPYPSKFPSLIPTASPESTPRKLPSPSPSGIPSPSPSKFPSPIPNASPESTPSELPSPSPSGIPSPSPSKFPSPIPTVIPSPTPSPIQLLTKSPTKAPSAFPSTPPTPAPLASFSLPVNSCSDGCGSVIDVAFGTEESSGTMHVKFLGLCFDFCVSGLLANLLLAFRWDCGSCS